MVIWSIFIRFSTLDTNPPNAIIVSCPCILFLTKFVSTSLCEYLPSYGITFEKQYVLYPRTVIHDASLCSEWFRRNATGDGLMPSMRSLFIVLMNIYALKPCWIIPVSYTIPYAFLSFFLSYALLRCIIRGYYFPLIVSTVILASAVCLIRLHYFPLAVGAGYDV